MIDTDGAARESALQGQRDASRWITPYVILVDIIAVALATLTLPGLPAEKWPALLLFIVFAALAEAWAVPMLQEGEVSLLFIAILAAGTLFGPCFAALAAAGGCVLAGVLVHRAGAMKIAFNAGQFAIAGALTGITYLSFGGAHGHGLTYNAAAYAAAAAAFVLSNGALTAGVLAL